MRPDQHEGWVHKLKNPDHTLALNYTDFGNEKLGKSVALVYTLGTRLIDIDKLSLTTLFGIGGAYFTEKHDPVTNPENQAIGSNVTFIVRFGSELRYTIKDWGIGVRWDLDHFSTAAIAQPNIGINKHTFGLMAYRRLREVEDALSGNFEQKKRFHVILGTGTREVQEENYRHWNTYVFYSLPIVKLVSFSAGSTLFYNSSLRQEQILAGVADPKTVRWGVMAGAQLHFKRLITNLHVGRYLINPFNDDGSGYQNIMIRYFFNRHLSAAMSLIAHNYNESYSFDMGLGLSF